MLQRGNFLYTPFAYVVLLLVIITVFYEYGKIWLINLFWVCLLLPQYAMAVYIERGFPGVEKYIELIRERVPQKGLPIYGSMHMWYAFKDKRDFYHYTMLEYDNILPDSFVVSASNDAPGAADPKLLIDMLNRSSHTCKHLDTFYFHNLEFNTWFCQRK